MRGRGQIALWMLTKFAIVFFIIALSLVMLNFANAERDNLCSTQARVMALSVASSFDNLFNSPVEDERKVMPLEMALSVGRDNLARYSIILLNKQKSGGGGNIVITVNTSAGCVGVASSSYGAKIRFNGLPADKPVLINPSQGDYVDLAKYLILMKCKPKFIGMDNYVFVEACKNENPDTCQRLDTGGIEKCCGWAWSGQPSCRSD